MKIFLPAILVLLSSATSVAAPSKAELLKQACDAWNEGKGREVDAIIYAHPELLNDGCNEPFLIAAARGGNEEFVMFALKHNANEMVRSGGGQTVLHVLARDAGDSDWARKRYLSTLKLMSLTTTTVNAKDDWGRTPLHNAVRVSPGGEEIMELLLRHGAETEVKGQTGYTPLADAVAQGSRTKVELLLKFGADINGHEGEPLFAAMVKRDITMMKFLLEKGADLNSRSKTGRPPLIWAASAPHYIDTQPSEEKRAKDDEDYLPVVEFLLKNGANKSVKDQYGHSALRLAESVRHSKVAGVLRRYGVTE